MSNKFEKMFVPGALALPDRIIKRDSFCATASFCGPKRLILDGYATPIENQGAKPWCAAYAATSYAESILWRKNGYHKDIDPAPIYRYCKSIDGNPNGDGTTLTAAMQALLAKKIFNSDICKVKTIGGDYYGNPNALNDVKYAIHRYGCLEVGLSISTSWYKPVNGVISTHGKNLGGHAVLCVGYDEDGFLILNSWGEDYGHDGKVYLPNGLFEQEFMYGALLTHVLDGLE